MITAPENLTDDLDILVQNSEDLNLMIPRGSDRRQRSEDGPPWITDEGFVMEDRREGSDRRRKKS